MDDWSKYCTQELSPFAFPADLSVHVEALSVLQPFYSRPSVARTLMARLPRLFRLGS